MKSILVFLLFLSLISTQQCSSDADCSGSKCHPEQKTCVQCMSDNDCGDQQYSYCQKNKCTQCQNDSSCQRFADVPKCSPYYFKQNGCISKTIYEQFLNNGFKNEKQINIKTPSDLLCNPKENLIFDKQQNKITLNFKTQEKNYPKLLLFQRKVLVQQQYQDIHIEIGPTQDINNLNLELDISNFSYGENLIELYILIINDEEMQKNNVQNPLGTEYFVKVQQKIMIVENKANYLQELKEKEEQALREKLLKDEVIQEKQIIKIEKNDCQNYNITGIIVGAVLGTLAFTLIIGGISIFFFRKYKSQNKELKYQENGTNGQMATEQNFDLKV